MQGKSEAKIIPKHYSKKVFKKMKNSLDNLNLLWYSSQALSRWCSSVGRAADL